MSETNDLFVKAWIEGLKPQSTDVHWRCSTGKASWNWRMKFQLELPLKTPEFGRLHIQLWDKDLTKWNDIIGETQLDLYRWLQKAYHEKKTVLPFKEMKNNAKNINMMDDSSTSSEDENNEEDENENEENIRADEAINQIEKAPLLSSKEKMIMEQKEKLLAGKKKLLNLKEKIKIPRLKKKKGSSKLKSNAAGGNVGTRVSKKAEKEQNEAREAINSFMVLDLIYRNCSLQ